MQDKKAETNFEHIKNMSKEELAQWLDKLLTDKEDPIAEWFTHKYCDTCEPILHDLFNQGVEQECSYCEINSKCKFFQEYDEAPDSIKITELWLDEEFN